MEMLNKKSRKSLNDSLASQSVTFRDVNFGEQSLSKAESFALFKLHSMGLRSQPGTYFKTKLLKMEFQGCFSYFRY